jgi:ribosomal-protein-alanine N-acetyltransferase
MGRINFTPFPVLSTDRLILRQLTESDDLAIFQLRSNEAVNQYIERPVPSHIDEARAFIQKINDAIGRNESVYWSICLSENDGLVGTVCLWNFSDDMTTAELGYELMPAFQGQGIMNESIKAVISYAFETLKFEKLEAFTHKENIQSAKLLLKNNFVPYPRRIDESNFNNIVYILKK